MIARGWDEAASGYEAYFVPRFAPWVDTAVGAVPARAVPDGPILVPCCGTFPELGPLLERFPDRQITGIDLSAGMVRLARERAVHHPNATVVQGDAAALGPEWMDRCGAVVSVFGLQQLPQPDHAIGSWAAALRPGGRLSVLFWPDVTEPEGPFALLGAVLRPHVPAADRTWQDRLTAALTEQGTTVRRDEPVAFPMTQPSAAAFFEAYTRFGPLRGLAIARGDEFIDQLRAEFLRRAPDGEWRHRPQARLIVADRQP